MVSRVVQILGVFERSAGRLTLGQITIRTGLPRSSVHRILQQLVDARWLRRDGGEYSLGIRMFELGSHVAERTRVTDVARPIIHELCATTKHVVHLGALDEFDVVYLEKIGGPFAGTLPSRVGGRFPAHAAAVGKALLALSPRAMIDHHLQHGLDRRTSATIVDPDKFEAEMLRIRDRGYATDNSEAAVGVACVAAPILEDGYAIAAVSVCGPARGVRVDELKHRVMWTAAEITRRLASASPPKLSEPQLRPAWRASESR
ncbi:IclR family transcriptional regulator [Microbacterium lacus]|uniref:IclR family transcriptional regulator n=1 Tax=Microbacterium lacus TaxID=415217 RepID=UPI001E2D821C|nr:IclR family transcriptional regulator [Microbacterium lacus]